jgi:hypothetical protein
MKEKELRKETIIIIRLIGTLKTFTNIYSIFKSIEKQLKLIFKIKISSSDENEFEKNEKFTEKLSYISEKYLKNGKLLILLDSIDQLTEENLRLNWFFNILPKNIKIIYSVLKSHNNNIFEILKKRIRSENFYEIKPLTNKEAYNILSKHLKVSSRQLTKLQMDQVNEMINNLKDISHLQIKLIFSIISKWNCSLNNIPKDFMNCKTSVDLVKYIFKKIENEIFKDIEILFKHCLFYLTLFKFRGISEKELECILSIDDRLLTSIFIHDPSVRRFPMVLWYQFKYEIKDYVRTSVFDNDSFISWFMPIIVILFFFYFFYF